MILSRVLRTRALQAPPLRVLQSLNRHASTSAAQDTQKPYYVTTPIFYPNAVPHIGHLHTLVSADILARFRRLTHPHQPVHFLTGTDEHGLKIQKAAREKGMEELAFCDSISERFRELAEKADISHTRFIRTTEQAHHDAVTHLWRELDAKGLIYKDTYSGWYSISDEAFYTDAQITRTVHPKTATEVVTSTETGSVVTYSSEITYKFRLSQFREALHAHFLANPTAIRPKSYYDQVLSWVSTEEGGALDDLSISRPRERLTWGVPVPGDEEHTIYVWIDALTVYLTGAGYPFKDLDGVAGGWPSDVQVVGKDILRFHAVYFPAILLALSLPLPQTLLTHAHWTAEQRKMSKSVGNVADPGEAMEAYGVDGVRYYMAKVGGRFKDDVDWSPVQAEKHLDEIRSLLGNFFLRITSKAIAGKLNTLSDSAPSLAELASASYLAESGEGEKHTHNREVLASLETLGDTARGYLENMEVAEALDAIVARLKLANASLTHTAPWASTTSPGLARASYLTSLETLRVCGILLQSFIPGTAGKLLDGLGVGPEERTWEWAAVGKGGDTTREVKGVPLFEGKRK
ncbi:hypothetical protein FIBSPDRAFT_1045598 [Athelia psychrophila]|uniref:Probable methionine--tRNA ligase, mitochondrial n=1 Tax=Athelia psychrophila TaxID=1759441 RepID=A0A166I055_9AGAM|nr:hypothetical protein FIBSPDRAFT_1045598 [Fibularhizoctonia sp. CBS 109695]